MGVVIVMIGFVIMLLLLSITFFKGKGSFLIAGYNTASDEEQKKYNKRKLCTSMGVCTAVITGLLVIMTFATYLVVYGKVDADIMKPVFWVFSVVIILDVILTNIYIMKKCMVK